MPQQLLRDPDVFPSEEVIFAHLGKARRLWEQVLDRLPVASFRSARRGAIMASCEGSTAAWREANEVRQ